MLFIENFQLILSEIYLTYEKVNDFFVYAIDLQCCVFANTGYDNRNS